MNKDNQEKTTKRKFGCLSSLVIVIIGVIVIIIAVSIFYDSTPPNQTSSNNSVQTDAFKLAALEIGHNSPSDSLVNTFNNLINTLEKKCPNEGKKEIANYIYKTKEMIGEKGISITFLEAGNAINGSMPEEAIGVVSCAEAASAIVVLTTNQ